MIEGVSIKKGNELEENNNIEPKDNTFLLLNDKNQNELNSVNDGLLLNEKNPNNLSLHSKKAEDKYSVIKESSLKKNIEENNSPLKFPFNFSDILKDKKNDEMTINVDKKNCFSVKQNDLLICNQKLSCCKETLKEKPKSKEFNNIVFKNLLENSNKKKGDNYKVNEIKQNEHPQNMLVFNLQYPNLNNIKESQLENEELNANINKNQVFNLEKIRNDQINTFENNNLINNEDKNKNKDNDMNIDKMNNLNLKNNLILKKDFKLIENDVLKDYNKESIENNSNQVMNRLNENLENNQIQSNSSSKKINFEIISNLQTNNDINNKDNNNNNYEISENKNNTIKTIVKLIPQNNITLIQKNNSELLKVNNNIENTNLLKSENQIEEKNDIIMNEIPENKNITNPKNENNIQLNDNKCETIPEELENNQNNNLSNNNNSKLIIIQNQNLKQNFQNKIEKTKENEIKENNLNDSVDNYTLPKELTNIFNKNELNKNNKIAKSKRLNYNISKENILQVKNDNRNSLEISMNINKIKSIKRGISSDTYNYYSSKNLKMRNSTDKSFSPKALKINKNNPSLNKPESGKNSRKNNIKVTYCPRIHPERVMKKWGEVSGKNWYKLSPNSRFKANEEMNQMIKDGKL